MPNRPAGPPLELRASDCCAEIRAHGTVMRYRRRGTGTTVLVLAEGSEDQGPELTEALSASFRVLTPELPADRAARTSWLSDFLEGLGARNVGLVALGELCSPARELALLRPDQIARMVLVPNGDPEDPGIGARRDTVADGERPGTVGAAEPPETGEAAPVPLLVVSCPHPVDVMIPVITAFLQPREAPLS